MFHDQRFAAFLFDMDGTVINSIAATERAWGDWARGHGLDVDRFLPTIHGIRAIDTIRSLNLPGADPLEEAAKIERAELTDMTGVVAIPGAPEFLSSLPRHRWAIVTSAPRELALLRLGAAGIPLPDAMVERLRAGAAIEPVLVDAEGAPVAIGRVSSSISPKLLRAVLLRDGHCRCGNCDLRYGLHAHHLRPRSWGGSDDPSNLAMVASVHHPMLIPHGPFALVGNPNRPDGLRLKHLDDLTPEEAEQVGLPRSRARPGAA